MNDKHCETCTCGRRAPVQESRTRDKGAGTISWAEHLAAYAAYSAQYGSEQSPERLAERAGFSYSELVDLLGHEPQTYVPGNAERHRYRPAASTPEERKP